MELPPIKTMVGNLPALAKHQATLSKLLHGRDIFCAVAPQLRDGRRGFAAGADYAVPEALARSVMQAMEQFAAASKELERLKKGKEPYPERLHGHVQDAIVQMRMHATGRYRGHNIPVWHTELTVAMAFEELVVWQQCLTGKLPLDHLKETETYCGGCGDLEALPPAQVEVLPPVQVFVLPPNQ